jgi:thiosulfate/3-mercaptopyruvate sulfurtransferase
MSFSFNSWLKNRKTNFMGTRRNQPRSTARTPRPAPARCRPSLEALEDRLAPATLRTYSALEGLGASTDSVVLAAAGSSWTATSNAAFLHVTAGSASGTGNAVVKYSFDANPGIIAREPFEKLVGGAGISPQDMVILYGDNNNWFAAYGFWLFKLYGHKDVRLMNGGRVKWLNEPDKELTTEPSSPRPVAYKVTQARPELRALLPDIQQAVKSRACNLVDVRSADEYTGKVIAPPGMTETAQRGGHIPGARCVPWSTAVSPDGRFKSADELQTIYLEQKSVDPNRPTIAYCRIGERSSHTWFVLSYLLGLKNVRNYDGSWTEYGNLIGAQIEK